MPVYKNSKKKNMMQRFLGQGKFALIAEGALVLIAVLVAVSYFNAPPAEPITLTDNTISRLEAIIASQEMALANEQNIDLRELKTAAWERLRAEDFPAAAELYSLVLEVDSSDFNIYVGRGYAHGEMENFHQSIADYTSALELNPNSVISYVNRCWAYGELDQWSNAITDCTSALNISENAYAYLNRGVAYERTGNPDASAQDLYQWMNLKRTETFAYSQASGFNSFDVEMQEGYLHYIPFQGQAGQTINVSAISVSEETVDTLLVILDGNGNPVIASDDVNDTLNSNIMNYVLPSSGTFNIVVGHAGQGHDGMINVSFEISRTFADYKIEAFNHFMAEEYREAYADFVSALEINPNDAETMNWMGITLRHLGDYSGALEAHNQAKDLNFSYDLAYLSSGITNELLDNDRTAATNYMEWIDRNRTHTLTHVDVLQPGETLNLNMHTGWVHEITFDAHRGQKVSLRVKDTGVSGFVDPLIVLLDPDGNPVIGSDDVTLSNYNSLLNAMHITMDGEYTLVVSHAAGGSNGELKVDMIQSPGNALYDYLESTSDNSSTISNTSSSYDYGAYGCPGGGH